MKKKLICIECPKGCGLTVDIKDRRVFKVEGNACPKGEKYAVSEVENPKRVITSTVLAKNLPLKMIPVKTDAALPKDKIFDAMSEIRKIVLSGPVRVGDIIKRDLAGLGVNLVATRGCGID